MTFFVGMSDRIPEGTQDSCLYSYGSQERGCFVSVWVGEEEIKGRKIRREKQSQTRVEERKEKMSKK